MNIKDLIEMRNELDTISKKLFEGYKGPSVIIGADERIELAMLKVNDAKAEVDKVISWAGGNL